MNPQRSSSSTLHPPTVLPSSTNSLTHALGASQQHHQHSAQAVSSSNSQHLAQSQSQDTRYYRPQTQPPPQPGPSSSSFTAPPSTIPPDEPPPAKRKRGRPKGSKTKNRRVDGVSVPVQSGTVAGGAEASHLAQGAPESQGNAIGDEDDGAGSADESPHHGPYDRRRTSSPVLPPGTSDGAAYGLGVGLSNGGASASAPGTSSDFPVIANEGGSSDPQTNASIKNFYDFQWQVISLCSVFYESAGDLVVSLCNLRVPSFAVCFDSYPNIPGPKPFCWEASL